MNLVKTLVFLSVTILFSACCYESGVCIEDRGSIKKENREVGSFKVVNLHTTGTVYVSQGDRESLVVEAGEKILKYINTEVKNGILELKINKSLCIKKLKYYITMKEIKGFKILGSGNIYGKTSIKTEDFFLKISGSGDMKFENVETFKTGILIRGSGDVKMNGKSEKCSIEISGSGSIHTPDFIVDYLDVLINGSGDTRITVRKELEATINGSGDVFYQGEPENVNIHINGSGDVSKKNL